jgi:hypothetical protein
MIFDLEMGREGRKVEGGGDQTTNKMLDAWSGFRHNLRRKHQ